MPVRGRPEQATLGHLLLVGNRLVGCRLTPDRPSA